MEKPTIYASAPKPPKQIRMEETPVETQVEQQDSPENEEQPRSAITVMQPTSPKDSVVKLTTTTSSSEEKTNVADNEFQKISEQIEAAAPTIDTTTATESTNEVDETKLDDSIENEAAIENNASIENNATVKEDTTKTEDVSQPIADEIHADEPDNVTAEASYKNIIEKNQDESASVEATSDEQNSDFKAPELTDNNTISQFTIDAALEDIPTVEIPIQENTDIVNQLPVDEKKVVIEESATPVEDANEETEPISSLDEHALKEEPTATAELTPNLEEPLNQEIKLATEPKNEKVSKSGAKQKISETEYEFENLKIPIDDELFQRQYYTMGEVATMFHANQSQIRFWENEFDILQPKKNKKGDRYFRPEDVKNLQVIHHLLRNRRFTIEGAREYLKSNKQRTQDTVSAIASLSQLKSFLVELKANL